MSPLLFSELIRGSLIPSLLLALLLFVTGSIKEPMRARIQAALWALAFVASLSVYDYHLLLNLSFPPPDLASSLIWGAPVLVLFVWLRPKPLGARYVLRAIFVGGIGWLILGRLGPNLMNYVHLRNLAAFFFLGLGIWSIFERSARLVQVPALVTLPLISVGALTMLLLWSGGRGHALALIAAEVAALFVAVLGVALVAPNKISEGGLIPFFSVLVIALQAAGHFYLHINPWTMIYLCVPFFVLWIRGWLPFLPKRGSFEALVLALICLVPLGYFLMNYASKILHRH